MKGETMKGVFGFSLVMLGSLAMGQANTCPIHIDKWKGNDGDRSRFIDVRYTNTSDKEISAWTTKVTSLDILGHEHKLVTTPIYVTQGKKPLAPNKTFKAAYHNDPFLQSGSYRMRLYQVRFTDGTSWVGDDDSACYADSSF